VNNIQTPRGWTNAPREMPTPTPTRGKTKWDETPVRGSGGNKGGATPTPQGSFNMATPSPGVSIFIYLDLSFRLNSFRQSNTR
jgi:hypothetical protein